MYRSILIGWQAGISAPYVAGTCTGQDNIYIGTNAGRGHTGDNNITLLASPTYGDTFHPDEGDFSNRMNLGNTIFGTTAHLTRMIQLGEMPTRVSTTDEGIGATLAVRPDGNLPTQPTMWLKRNSGQAAPILMSHTDKDYNLFGNLGHEQVEGGTFAHIKHNGVLCVPFFESLDGLRGAIPPTDNAGAIAFVNDEMYIVQSTTWVKTVHY